MIVAVHALAGAALSKVCRTRAQAFLLGAASHLAGDLLPHRDLELPAETVLAAGALGFVAAKCGFGSREFAGALGAACPDAENAAGRLLRVPEGKLLWPTHRRYHGPKADGVAAQVTLALVCLAIIAAPHCACAGECGNP